MLLDPLLWATLGISLILVQRFFSLFNLLNPFVAFFLYCIVFAFSGVLYDHVYAVYGIFISWQTKLLLAYGLFAIVIGAMFAQLLSGITFTRSKLKNIRLLSPTLSEEHFDLIAGIAMLALGVAFYLLFVSITGFKFWEARGFNQLRIVAARGLGPIVQASQTLIYFGGFYLLLHQRLGWLMKIVVLSACLISLFGFGSREPALKFMVGSGLLFFLLHRGHIPLLRDGRRFVTRMGKIPILAILFLGTAAFLVNVVLGAFRQVSDQSLMTLISARMFWRPFVNVYNLERILAFFPSSHDFLYGYGYAITFIDFIPIHSFVNIGNWVKTTMGLTFQGGSVTVTYIGYDYLNFGWFGAIVSPFLSGFILNMIYLKFIRNGKITKRRAILGILISLSLMGASSMGLFHALLWNTLLFALTALSLGIIESTLVKK